MLDGQGKLRQRILSPDPPLGIVEGRQFATLGDVKLNAHDTLFYTDGIVETFNEQEEQFGEPRLIATVADLTGQSSQATIDEIFDRVHHFASEASYQDNMTAVVLKVRPDWPR